MRHADVRKMFNVSVSLGALSLAGCVGSNGFQGGFGGGMMGGGNGHGWMGGYGGPSLLVVILVAALAAWFVTRGRNKN